jgi:RimJ/RimL family protein N-acetyltransferase
MSENKPASFLIREAIHADAPVLVKAEQEIAATPGSLVSHPSELILEKFEQKIADLTDNPRGKYLVAVRGNELIGHALLDPLHLIAIRHVVHLTIAVHPGFQGEGVGEALLSRLVEWAKSAKEIEKIELHVRSGNLRAIALYKKLGFTEEGRLKKRVKVADGQYFDDVLMGLFV